MYAGNAVSVLFEFLQRLSEYSIGEVLEVVIEPETIEHQRKISLSLLLGGEGIERLFHHGINQRVKLIFCQVHVEPDQWYND